MSAFDNEYRNKCDELSNKIIGAAIEVHKTLGPGLLESTYEECLCYELSSKGIGFKRQLSLPVNYKGKVLDAGYKIDILVENLVIVELKAIEQFLPIHTSQLITYLKLSDKWLGLLINFNVKYLDKGIKRIVNG